MTKKYTRDQMAARVAQDIPEGAYVNLGIGLPTKVADHLPAEREVFLHLIAGQLNKQVAADLQITERTIKLHRANILEKLEVGSMAELARLAADLGIDPAGGEPV